MNREEQIKMWEEAAKKVDDKKHGKVNVNSTNQMNDDLRNKHDTPNKSKYPKR